MKTPKPFYRKALKTWYVSINRKMIRLGGGPPNSPPEAVMQKYYALMANGQPTTVTTAVQSLVGKYLSWTEKHRAPETYEWYRRHLASFVAHIPPKLTIDKLKPLHVNAWLEDKYAEAGGSYQNSAVRSVKRVCNWAVKQGEIAASPLLNIESPQPESRVVYLSAAEWGKTVAAVDRDDPFFDFVMFMYETGCRPQEARAIEGRHFDRAGEQIVFPIKESKGKKVSRVIPLTQRSLGIIRRLALKYPGSNEKLFRNMDGQPWTKDAINCRFTRLTEKLGFRIFAYAIRHTFITDALILGIDPATLACIVGHKDATMILKVYSHVNLNKGHIRAAAEKMADRKHPKPNPKNDQEDVA